MRNRKILISFLICFLILFLAACQQKISEGSISPGVNSDDLESSGDIDSNGLQQKTPEEVNSDDFEWITSSDNIDLNGMNLFWQNDNIQFVADKSAKLSIYVAAEKNDSGGFDFDDGQDWLVLLETSFGNFSLFPRNYVQLGGVSCSVFNDLNDTSPVSHVLVTVEETACYQLYDCIFDTEKKAFKVISVYEASNINYITNSK